MMKTKRTGIIRLLLFCTLAVSFVVAANVFLVAVGKRHLLSGTDLTAYVSNSNTVNETLISKRGYIYDKYGTILAQDVQTYNIICILNKDRLSASGKVAYVEDPVTTAKVLAQILDMDEMTIYQYLTPSDSRKQTELGTKGRNLSKEVKEKIEATNLPGIEFVKSVKRSYPMGKFASYLIGFAQSDETGHTTGKMGLELFLDEELTGIDGKKSYQADKNGYILPGMKSEETPAVNGNDVYLTLDQGIQETLESSLELTMEMFNADKAWGAVMEIDTGKILAWGQAPSFDPNTRVIDDYTNYGSQMPYEAGSVMKVFTYAAAIDHGEYDGDTLVDSSPFCYAAKNRNPYRVSCSSGKSIGKIGNASDKQWGMISYDMGLVYSSNVVTSSIISDIIEPSVFEMYMDKFGFFKEVGSYGISETVGIKNFTWPSDKLALTYGQGSTVTMLQILQAYSAVFSDGTMVKPYFIEQISNSDEIIYEAKTEVVDNPIREDTALKLQELMYMTANRDDGTARHYRIDETEIIAKTGTSQISIGGSYNSGKTISSVMVGLPADNPKYMVYYAFEADYDKNAHYKTEPVKQLLQKVAQTYNLTASLESLPNEEFSEVVETTMPSLINHSLDYSLAKLEESKAEIIVLGSGKTVINQYPEAKSTLVNSSKVILLTDSGLLQMPNMIGWSRKDVTGFWQLTDIAVRFTGYGLVSEQSIVAGTTISKEDIIEVTLQ